MHYGQLEKSQLEGHFVWETFNNALKKTDITSARNFLMEHFPKQH